MTIETKADRCSEIAAMKRAPRGRRHGEDAGWEEQPQSTRQQDEELVYPAISPPPISWPRVFPGI